MGYITRSIAAVVASAMVGMTMPLSVQAGPVDTESVAAADAARVDRDSLRGMLDRAEVRAQLQALGVDPEAARARIDTLSDDEIAQIQGRLHELPAGGSDILGVVFAVFIILLVTDILGLTKVFPFTRSVR